MDRIDAMKVFVAALDEGSLAGAARKLGRSDHPGGKWREPVAATGLERRTR